jgi:hypothetical protein
MNDLNNVALIGRLGRDAELRDLNSGTPHGAFSICVNGSKKDGDRYVNVSRIESAWTMSVSALKPSKTASSNASRSRSRENSGRLGAREQPHGTQQREDWWMVVPTIYLADATDAALADNVRAVDEYERDPYGLDAPSGDDQSTRSEDKVLARGSLPCRRHEYSTLTTRG